MIINLLQKDFIDYKYVCFKMWTEFKNVNNLK